MNRKKVHIKSKFFIRNLFTFMVPLLIPILILGILSSFITVHYANLEINYYSHNLLKQTKENIELMLNELDFLSLNFDNNVEIIVMMKELLKSPPDTLERMYSFKMIRNFLSAPSNARPYIHSIYVYYSNPQNSLMTTSNGFTRLEQFYDTEWYESFQAHGTDSVLWTESRDIYPYKFQKVHVVSIYKRLSSTNGVIVLNLLPAYINNSLHNLIVLEGQYIFILDENNHVLFDNTNMKNSNIKDSLNFEAISSGSPSVKINGKRYSVFLQNSDRYGWKYISLIPNNTLYQLPTRLVKYTSIIIFFTSFIGIVLAYLFTKKNYRQVSSVIAIIQAAESGSSLPPLPTNLQDEYSFIIHNIIKTFIEQNFLKSQLSEKKYKAQLMEIQALQAQINPHFLYNTLNAIYWKCIGLTGSPNTVTRMVENLSDILAYSLSNPVQAVTVNEEIKNAKSYVEIQQCRYQDRFTVVWQYSPDVIDCKIMKLLFQPFIENSIYHGCSGNERKRILQIKIRIRRFHEKLQIKIIDNGTGIEKNKLLNIRQQILDDNDNTHCQHIGIYNTVKRIRLIYGEQYSFHIRSHQNLGTAIYIMLPIDETQNSKK